MNLLKKLNSLGDQTGLMLLPFSLRVDRCDRDSSGDMNDIVTLRLKGHICHYEVPNATL